MKNASSYHNYLRFFCASFIFFHALRGINGLMLSQLATPFIFNPRQDPVIWNLIFSGIPNMFSGSVLLSGAMDVIVVIPSICLLIFIKKNERWVKTMVVLQLFLFAFYLLIIFSYPSLSIRKYLGLAVVPIAFLSLNESWFESSKKYLRAYVLFIFSSSASWKILRGGLFDIDQFDKIMRSQHFDHFLYFPNHISTQVGEFFIDHSEVGYIFYLMVTAMQLCFIVGFFTRKYDRLLLFAFLIFILGDYFVMRIEYWEFIVFIPLFINRKNYSSGA